MLSGQRVTSGWRRALYRTSQVYHALFPRLEDADLALAKALLSEPELALFTAMERRDQRHGLAVARRLRARGIEAPELLTAALLHDCGKGAVPVWLRVAYVLYPALVRSIAGGGPRGAAYRLVNHVPIGAQRLEAAGSSLAVVRLVTGAVEADEQAAFALLRAADDES